MLNDKLIKQYELITPIMLFEPVFTSFLSILRSFAFLIQITQQAFINSIVKGHF